MARPIRRPAPVTRATWSRRSWGSIRYSVSKLTPRVGARPAKTGSGAANIVQQPPQPIDWNRRTAKAQGVIRRGKLNRRGFEASAAQRQSKLARCLRGQPAEPFPGDGLQEPAVGEAGIAP